ncbi:hypothetical protein [Bacillus sp. UNCCL81]|nr:hypothetical protein [Bacillus sp. UNCCL81]
MKTIKIDHTTIIIHGDFVNLSQKNIRSGTKRNTITVIRLYWK